MDPIATEDEPENVDLNLIIFIGVFIFCLILFSVFVGLLLWSAKRVTKTHNRLHDFIANPRPLSKLEIDRLEIEKTDMLRKKAFAITQVNTNLVQQCRLARTNLGSDYDLNSNISSLTSRSNSRRNSGTISQDTRYRNSLYSENSLIRNSRLRLSTSESTLAQSGIESRRNRKFSSRLSLEVEGKRRVKRSSGDTSR